MAKGTGYRLFDHHFTELAHNKKGDKTGNGITQNNTRTGRLNNRCAAKEQACTDSATESDKLNMAVFKAALQLIAVLLTIHYETSCVVVMFTLWRV